MLAEVVAIGDELTSGERVDTNSAWLSKRLVELGISVRFHSTVGDDLASCADVVLRATERAEIVVITGGLGPTADDLTRDAIAVATGTELQLDEPTLEHITSLFRRRGREMPKANRVQAMFPQGSEIISNPHGTAPGIEMKVKRSDAGRAPTSGEQPCQVEASCLFALPGVPAEMKPMWAESVAPRIREIAPAETTIRHHQLKCFGVGESQLESMLPDLVRRGREPSVGITVHAATITLRVTAKGVDADACEAAMAPTLATIRECLGSLVFGEEEDELQDAVARILLQQEATLATAECATAGLAASWLAGVDEAGKIYRGGEVHTTEIFGAGDAIAEAVEEMAKQVRERFDADFGLAIGPLPELNGQGEAETAQENEAASGGKKIPQTERFYFAIADSQGCDVHSARTLAHPAIRKELAGKRALDQLRLRLLGEETHA